ncbi:MAG TPA: ankyrin repeat domain-containing protein [Fimbriimonas sp.]|nr:ankyrin repeat domain-containing protein [Fimbriimonas sp.]
MAVASTLSANTAKGQSQTRKSTDPPVAARGKLGQDLFLALDHQDLQAVRKLLKQGADPNARNGLEFVPLDMAAASHQKEAMEELLKAGAKPNADSAYGTPLTFAAASANVEGAMILLDRHVDVDSTRADGMTPLMMACDSGAPPMVQLLLQHKADLNAKDYHGTTALMVAARKGNDAAAAILIGAGAKVDASDDDGRTALMFAAQNGHAGSVSVLLKHGAQPNRRDSKGRSALILAATYGDYPAVVSALLKGGANPKATDARGRTAATLCAMHRKGVQLGQAEPNLCLSGKYRTPRQAVSTSLKLLQSSMQAFHDGTTCVSCHHEGLGRIATGAARDHGLRLDAGVQKEQRERIDGMLSALRPLHEQALKNEQVMKQVPLIEINEVTTADSWLLNGMAAQKEPATGATAAMAMVLAKQQMPNGSWSFSGPREPMQSSTFTFTALTVRALKAYAPRSSGREVAGRIEKAKNWLLTNQPRNSEDRAFRLLGLKWCGVITDRLAGAAKAVRADQRPDGGWCQLPNMQSDAYATGQALYALHEAGGMSASDPVYRRGIAYLLRTQDSDGSWFVDKRATPANNYFDAKFPNGLSQYASFNGTCWAVMALLDAVPAKKGRTTHFSG